MGTRGPRPTPKAKLATRGSRLAKSREGEPEPSQGMPVKPEWFGPIASAKWDEMLPALADMGVMAAVYGDFLQMYCMAHQDLHDAMGIIEREGMTCQSEKGGAYMHPAVAIKQNAIERIAKYGREFGMSPSSVRDVTKTNAGEKKSALSSSARKR